VPFWNPGPCGLQEMLLNVTNILAEWLCCPIMRASSREGLHEGGVPFAARSKWSVPATSNWGIVSATATILWPQPAAGNSHIPVHFRRPEKAATNSRFLRASGAQSLRLSPQSSTKLPPKPSVPHSRSTHGISMRDREPRSLGEIS
jgi:hypothetical protein